MSQIICGGVYFGSETGIEPFGFEPNMDLAPGIITQDKIYGFLFDNPEFAVSLTWRPEELRFECVLMLEHDGGDHHLSAILQEDEMKYLRENLEKKANGLKQAVRRF